MLTHTTHAPRPAGLSLQRMAFGCLRVGIRARAALTTAVARKCLNMAHITRDTAGEAVSFVAKDIGQIFDGEPCAGMLCVCVGGGSHGQLRGGLAEVHLTVEGTGQSPSQHTSHTHTQHTPGIMEVHYLWGAPIEAAAIMVLLGTLVGIYALPGVG